MTWRAEWEEAPRRSFGFGGGARGFGIAKWLVIACVVVTVANMIVFGQMPRGSNSPTVISSVLGLTLSNAIWIYPWFTYVLVHDPASILHIVFNGVLLWYLGIELEERLGRGKFLTLFFGAALVGAAAHVLVQALTTLDNAPLIGASGGIFGLIFFIARETPERPFVFFILPVPAKVLAGLFVILNVFPLLTGGLHGDGVAHLCHLGGAAFGLLWYRRQFDAFATLGAAAAAWRARAEEQRSVRSAQDDVEMDRLLKKIQDAGMPSLTARERAFLQERSRGMRDRGR